MYSAHALWYHYSRTCLHRTPVASTRRVVFLLFFPIFFLRWVSSVICVGRARGARPSSAPPPLSHPFWGKGEGHAARTYAKNIHHSWWIIRYPPPHRTQDVWRVGGKAEGRHGKQLNIYINGASLSEPLLDELAGAFLWYIYIYIYLYPWAVHLVPRGPPVNTQRANVRPAE